MHAPSPAPRSDKTRTQHLHTVLSACIGHVLAQPDDSARRDRHFRLSIFLHAYDMCMHNQLTQQEYINTFVPLYTFQHFCHV
jgi:ABC-type Na+ transport system ATPase subunit NatA